MLHTLSQWLGKDADAWMLLIELLVLVLIFVDIVARGIIWLRHWCSRRTFERRVHTSLRLLSSIEANALRSIALSRREPSAEITEALRKKMPGAFDNDFKGTCITPEYKALIQKWAGAK
jgi:hypothetical protein